jgi:predicted nucleic acid-binding protein
MFHHGDKAVVAKWSLVPDDNIWLSIITIGEVVRGRVMFAEQNNKNEQLVQDTCDKLFDQFTEELCNFRVCDYRSSALAIFRQLPDTVKLPDRRIAAIALDYDFVLVTHDKDFSRLGRRDLKTVDWAK